MTNHELVKKVIGPINPVGETNNDAERFSNLESMCLLVEALLYDIDDIVTRNSHSHEASVKRISEYARKFLKGTVHELVRD